MGCVQDLFRPRVPRVPCLTSDISTRRIRIALHESRTRQLRIAGRNAQQQEEALENLVTSTVADWQAVTSLSSRNATLINELRAATATIATLQQRLEICSCATTPPTGAGGQQSRQTSHQRQHNPVRDTTPLDPNGYCWSHGYRVSMRHNRS